MKKRPATKNQRKMGGSHPKKTTRNRGRSIPYRPKTEHRDGKRGTSPKLDGGQSASPGGKKKRVTTRKGGKSKGEKKKKKETEYQGENMDNIA